MIRLLKSLTETEEVKRIMWMSADQRLEQEGIPKEFETKSRVVVILNDYQVSSPHIDSLEDRGLMVFFRPPVDEVIKVGRTFVKDREVLKFVEDHRPFVDALSLRSLFIAAEMKSAGLDWR